MKERLQHPFSSIKAKVALSCLMFCFGFTMSFAQTTIVGTVTDENNETMPNVYIALEGTGEGAATGFDGKYTLTTNQTGSLKLVASYMGYEDGSKAVTLNGGTVEVNFELASDPMNLDEVIVTGVVNEKSKLESSVSITSLDPKTIEQSAPRTTAEIFRTIPGIKVEASAGDGNTNITARGVPISAGGSRYLQLQEDGLPLLLYGDIAFSTQDQYLRVDPTIARVEAIRGGSAAITTSNGPAGIINFISKTGAQRGGVISTSFGLNYNSFRTDFNVGSPLGNGVSLNIGGFLRQGEGPRNANHVVNNGGQIKANITKQFDKGFARVYVKMLNDKTAAYMPMPIQVTGTNENPTWESVDGLDAASNGLHSPFFQQNYGLDQDGNYRTKNISDGMETRSNAVGASFDFDIGNGWRFTSNSRMTFNKGGFVAPFTAQVTSTQALMDEVVTTNGDTTAAGAPLPYTINRVTSGEVIDDTENGLAQRIHLFDVELENFNNVMSDNRLSKSFNNVDLTFGTFYSKQTIQMSWLWSSYLMEVKQDGQLLNVNSASGDITHSGLVAYGQPYWGDCCTGSYNTDYGVFAPYANVAVAISDRVNLDGGLRYDFVNVNGTVTPSQLVQGIDMNGNGGIEGPEVRGVTRVDNSNAKAVNYNYGYLSYTLGVNFMLNQTNAVFARASQGYVGNAERATWHQGGPYLENKAPKNSLFQTELGYKKRFKSGGLFVTGFYAKTEEEAGVEATTQNVLSNDYSSFGVELESFVKIKSFDLRGAITYVKAEIVDNNDNVNIGNTPRRQPGLTYNILPSYNFKGGHVIGVSVIGQTSSYAQDNNVLKMPGYAIFNAYFRYNITKGLAVNLNVNNLANTMGITESEEGSIVEGQTNFVRARSISGRSIVGGITFNF